MERRLTLLTKKFLNDPIPAEPNLEEALRRAFIEVSQIPIITLFLSLEDPVATEGPQ